jgi:GH24 family phage-related lysozyme (muramidase)
MVRYFERWIYASGKVLNGLVRRRKEGGGLVFHEIKVQNLMS